MVEMHGKIDISLIKAQQMLKADNIYVPAVFMKKLRPENQPMSNTVKNRRWQLFFWKIDFELYFCNYVFSNLPKLCHRYLTVDSSCLNFFLPTLIKRRVKDRVKWPSIGTTPSSHFTFESLLGFGRKYLKTKYFHDKYIEKVAKFQKSN